MPLDYDPETLPFKMGDRVRFPLSPTIRGRVVLLRGPIGHNGAMLYRVRIKKKPNPLYVEVPAEMMVHAPAKPAAQTDAPAN